MTPSDKAEAERQITDNEYAPCAALMRDAYIVGREDERAAPAHTVPVSREWLESVRAMLVDADCPGAMLAEIDRLLAEGARG